MTKETVSHIFMIAAFAAVLALIAFRREAAVMVSTAAGHANNPGGLQDLATMAPAAYLAYNWGPPPAQGMYMPQVSQGGSLSPKSYAGDPCGNC